MNKLYRISILLICFISGNELMAQTMAASPYSYFGIGSLYRKGSSHNRSLGGTGIGLRDSYSINNLNPASYTAIAQPFSQLTEVGLMVTVGQQQEGNDVVNEVELDFPGMAMWFRMNDHWASTIGLVPYSTVDYHIKDEASYIGLGSEYGTEYVGSGGLSQLYFGLARTLFTDLSIGANFSYIFGPLTSTQNITSTNLNNWQIEENTHLHTFAMDMGLQYVLHWGKSDLSLGTSLNLGSKLKGTYTYKVLQSDVVVEEEEENVDDYILPASVGFGLSWSRNQQWRLSADVSAERWSDATFEDGYQLQDAQRISFGAERLPTPNDFSFLQRTGYSMGVFHEENYLSISGNRIETNGITAGIKFPVSSSSLIHLTVEHYLYGNSNLITQRYTQLSCNISFFDVWFVKRKME